MYFNNGNSISMNDIVNLSIEITMVQKVVYALVLLKVNASMLTHKKKHRCHRWHCQHYGTLWCAW